MCVYTRYRHHWALTSFYNGAVWVFVFFDMRIFEYALGLRRWDPVGFLVFTPIETIGIVPNGLTEVDY